MSLQVYKKSEFSRIAGVSKAAITKAERAGHIVVEDKRIDITHPKNAAYLASNRDRRPKVNNGELEKNGFEPKPSPKKMESRKIQPRIYRESGNLFGTTKEAADVLRIQAQTANLQLKYAERLKILVFRKDVEQVFQKIYSVAVNYFLVFGDRLAPILASLCNVNDQKIIIEMKNRIDKEVSRALEELKRQTEIEL